LAEPARSVDPRHLLAATTPNFKCHSPAELRPAPDDRGESDFDFFAARATVNERVRLPFPDEFAPELLKPGAFIHVLLIRDPLTNEPRTRARAIFYSDIDGGRA
jgi:hypothetical protein